MTKSIRGKKAGIGAQEPLFSRDYVLLMFTALCHAMMNQFFITSIPLYIGRLGGTVLTAGVFSTVYSSSALIARPVAGVISDKFGRISQIIIGAAICSVCSALFGVFSVIPLLIFARALHGIGFGMHSTCAGAAAADVIPKSRMSEGIGYFFLYATISQAIGPGIALTMVSGDTTNEYKTLFFLSAALCLSCVITSCFITYERKRRKAALQKDEALIQDDTKNPTAQVNDDNKPLPKTFLGFEYSILVPTLVMILLQIGLTSIMIFLAVFARWKGLGNPSLYFLVSAAGALTSRMIFGRIADRRGSDIIIIPSMAVLVVCLSIIPLVESLPMLIVLGLPIGLAQGAVFPTFSSMLFKRCTPARRGSASGASFSAIDIGIAIGSLLLGAIADAMDFRFIYWTGAVSMAIGLIIFLFVASDRQYKKRVERTT